MLKICAFGEILLRITPDSKKVFSSLPEYANINYGGSEVNFLSNVANCGGKSYFISAIPSNYLGNGALSFLYKNNINIDEVILSKKGRMGLYFLEEGAGFRSSSVLYDRENSSINYYDFEDYNFEHIFGMVNHFHISGITPALSEKVFFTSLRALKLAKKMGLKVSCDLNYRKNLWNYELQGDIVDKRRVMTEIVSHCDYLFGNEMDLQKFFTDDVDSNEYSYEQDDIVYYENLLLHFSKDFPHLNVIALSIRKSINATSNTIGGVAYVRSKNQFFSSPNIGIGFTPYKITNIVDRVGSGDAFSSGFLVGLNEYKSIQKALDFATASSVIKHSYYGDVSNASFVDIQNIINSDKFGRIIR